MKRALLIVDCQQDFMPGGNLAVKDGDKIVPGINDLIASSSFDVLVFTQDCHPKNHGSFASNHPGKKPFEMGELNGLSQMLWPNHCVQGTKGMDFHPDLEVSISAYFVFKGMDPNTDSYSAFYDNNGQNPSGLSNYLKEMKVKEVLVCGLAFNYCVLFTALDSKSEGFRTIVIEDLCKSAEVNTGDHEEAKKKMTTNGIEVIKRDAVKLEKNM